MRTTKCIVCAFVSLGVHGSGGNFLNHNIGQRQNRFGQGGWKWGEERVGVNVGSASDLEERYPFNRKLV